MSQLIAEVFEYGGVSGERGYHGYDLLRVTMAETQRSADDAEFLVIAFDQTIGAALEAGLDHLGEQVAGVVLVDRSVRECVRGVGMAQRWRLGVA